LKGKKVCTAKGKNNERVLLKDALQLQCIAQVEEDNAVDHARLVNEK
jgi:hypothetical protein